MSTIGSHNLAAMGRLAMTLPPRDRSAKTAIALAGRGSKDSSAAISLKAKTTDKEQVRKKFTQFVGETFYGQMLKSMRSTVAKPAYFNGGHAEDVFQAQLDQTMAQELTKSTASKFVEPLFEQQFPQYAETKPSSNLAQLNNLRRL
jgi:peptidoglycan hydrolase FlgJ